MSKNELCAVVYKSKDGETLWGQLGKGSDQAKQIQEIESSGGQVLEVTSQKKAISRVSQPMPSCDDLRR